MGEGQIRRTRTRRPKDEERCSDLGRSPCTPRLPSPAQGPTILGSFKSQEAALQVNKGHELPSYPLSILQLPAAVLPWLLAMGTNALGACGCREPACAWKCGRIEGRPPRSQGSEVDGDATLHTRGILRLTCRNTFAGELPAHLASKRTPPAP